MKVLIPNAILDANLISSTVAETDYTVFDAAHAYVEFDRVRVVATNVHLVYESLKGASSVVTISNGTPAVMGWTAHGRAVNERVKLSTTGTLPAPFVAGTDYYIVNPGTDNSQLAANVGGAAIASTTAGSGVHTCTSQENVGKDPQTTTGFWQLVGATNRWAMFDAREGSQTTGASPMTIVFKPGRIGAVRIAEVVGTAYQLSMKDSTGGTVVYNPGSVTLDDSTIDGPADWFYADYVQKTGVSVTNIPDSYTDPELTLTVTGTGTLAIGLLAAGPIYDLGGTEVDCELSMKDYSRWTEDGFASMDVDEGTFSYLFNCRLRCTLADFNRNKRLLTSLRATPAIFIPDDAATYEALTIYGFPGAWTKQFPAGGKYFCTLQVKGLPNT